MWGTLLSLGLMAGSKLLNSGGSQPQAAPAQSGGKPPTQSLLEQVLLNRLSADQQEKKTDPPPASVDFRTPTYEDPSLANLHAKPFNMGTTTQTVLPDPQEMRSKRRSSLIFGDE